MLLFSCSTPFKISCSHYWFTQLATQINHQTAHQYTRLLNTSLNTTHFTCSNHHVTNLMRQYQDWFNTITLIPSYYVPQLHITSKIMQLVIWMESRVEPDLGFDKTDITKCKKDISLSVLYMSYSILTVMYIKHFKPSEHITW